jgi:hypothetical protein
MPAGAADGDQLVKVYVVKDPAQTGGQADSLQSIAAQTMGDPARSGEILDLNRGRAQPDGTALANGTDVLQPGMILELPQDASGPDVQSAQKSADNSAPPGAAPANGTAQSAGSGSNGGFSVPLPAVVAVSVAILLALVTAGIMARRRLSRLCASVARTFRKLGDPGRRKRRLKFRAGVGFRFAADADSVRAAYGVLEEFAARQGKRETPVHALRVDRAGVTAWLPEPDEVPAPWQNVGGPLWRRPAGAASWLTRGAGESTGARSPAESACLVRVGTDDDGEPVFVDLSRLDGTLSVTGDHAVARDVVRTLLAEVARSRPGLPVTVLRGTDGAPPIPVPPELNQMTQVQESLVARRAEAPRGTLRGVASRRPVKGLVVMSGNPTEREAADLAVLCGPGGAGWTGLVCGEVRGAHWRWSTDSDGRVDIPVLGVTLTVPA